MDHGLILTIALFACIALAPFLSNITKIPITIIEITLGILGAYFGLFTKNEYFFIVAKVGFLFMMFIAGLEVDLKEFARMKKEFLTKAAAYFAILYLLAILAYNIFSLSPIYIVILPIFSLGMIMALIKEFGKNEKWLGLALMIGIAGELISIVAITVMTGALTQGFGIPFVKTLLTLAGFCAAAWLVFRISKTMFWWFPELKNIIIPFQNAKDQDIRFAMALFFILIAMSMWLRIDMVLGAFFAGIFLSTFFRHKNELYDKLFSLCFGFFAPIFFIYVGSTLELKTLFIPQVLDKALLIIALLVSIRLIGSFSVFYKSLGAKNTLLFALSDSMPLMFMVAVATIGVNAKVISPMEYSSIILASMIDAVALMTLIKALHSMFAVKPLKQ
jgi:Kef-type K+ transport system membrane component KefB